jgi:hypothetical protein
LCYPSVVKKTRPLRIIAQRRVMSKPTINARAKITTNPITARIKDQLRLPEGQTGHDPLEI